MARATQQRSEAAAEPAVRACVVAFSRLWRRRGSLCRPCAHSCGKRTKLLRAVGTHHGRTRHPASRHDSAVLPADQLLSHSCWAARRRRRPGRPRFERCCECDLPAGPVGVEAAAGRRGGHCTGRRGGRRGWRSGRRGRQKKKWCGGTWFLTLAQPHGVAAWTERRCRPLSTQSAVIGNCRTLDESVCSSDNSWSIP